MSLPTGRVTFFNQKSFFECVLERAKKMERLLREKFQAEGRGLREKARSVQHLLDDSTSKKLEFIGAIRNKLVHEEEYVFDGDEEAFLRTCDEVIRRLSLGRQQTPPPPPRASRTTNQTNQSTRPSSHTTSSSTYSAPAPKRVTRTSPPISVFPIIRKLSKATFVVFALGLLVYVAVTVVPAMIANLPNLGSSVSGSRPQPQATVKVEKVSGGRTPNEKMYQFSIPARKWVETNIKIQPNQEVNIHHFTSNEQVTVSLGAMTDDRLQKAGTIMPLYTASDCSVRRNIHPTVSYTCVQLNQAESIKFYARNPVQVGVYVRPLGKEQVNQETIPDQTPVQVESEAPATQVNEAPAEAAPVDPNRPLLETVPYDQSKPQTAPAQAPTPQASPSASGERPRFKIAPGMTRSEPEGQTKNTNDDDEMPADGIFRLKKRKPQQD